MKKNDGFIATSLIYSFFLVFIAIILALINSYIANKTILNQFNEDIMDRLNNENYSIKLYVKNARVFDQNALDLTNIIQDSNFISMDNWKTEGTCTINNLEDFLTLTCSADSYIYQDIHLEENHKYYFAVEYVQTDENPREIYIENGVDKFEDYKIKITTHKTEEVSTIEYGAFIATGTDAQKFILGQSNNESTLIINRVILIDLTNISINPSPEWIYENVSWFSQSVNYVKRENINNESNEEFNITPYLSEADIKKQSCINSGGDDVSEKVVYDKEKKIIKVNEISGDIECNIEWSIDEN